MNRLASLTIDGLAAWRLSRLVVVEDSPVSLRVREAAEHHLPPAWAAAVQCQHCVGMWAGLGLGALRAVGLGWVAYPLAAAAVSSLGTHLLAQLGPDEPDDAFYEPQGPVRASVLDRLVEAQAQARDNDLGGLGRPPVGMSEGDSWGTPECVGRALNSWETETGRSGVDLGGHALSDGHTRLLTKAELTAGRLVR